MEQDDNFQYRDVSIYGDTVKFYVDALTFYAGRLKNDLDALSGDSDLSMLLDVSKVQSPIHRELERTERAIAWLNGRWDKDVNGFGITTSLSHGVVRFLKSVGSAYLDHLKERRNAVAGRSIASESVLGEIDRQIARFAEKLQIGVFGPATAKPLLAPGIITASPNTEQPLQPKSSQSVVLSGIELLDAELNSRCLDLFNTFSQGSQADRFDTVIMEATKILEHRLRHAAGLDSHYDGVKLVTAALSGPNPLIRLSSHSGEQEAGHMLFRGVFGFVRNPFHHRLIGTLAQQRVLQLLGMVDYMLHLVEAAQTTAQPPVATS